MTIVHLSLTVPPANRKTWAYLSNF